MGDDKGVPAPPQQSNDVPAPPEPIGDAGSKITQPEPNRKLLFGIGGGFLVAILIGALVGFIYLPNTPKNIYRRGMASVGQGLEDVLEQSLETDTPHTTYSGTFNMSKPSTVSATMSGGFASEGQGDMKLMLDIDGNSSEIEARLLYPGGRYPQLFLRMSDPAGLLGPLLGGFVDTSDPEVTSALSAFENWVVLDYEELGLTSINDETVDTTEQATFSQQQVQTIMEAIVAAANEHVFTSDLDDMVFQYTEDLGEEDYEGRSSRKYLVGFNAENYKNFLRKVRENLIATGLVEEAGLGDLVNNSLSDENIEDSVSDTEFSDTKIEVWVDLDTKVLRNIRFSPADGVDSSGLSHIDFSLLYEGGDELPFRIKIEGDDQEARGYLELGASLNSKANMTGFYVDADIEFLSEFSSDIKFDMRLDLEGTSEQPLIPVPEGATSVFELLGGSGVGSFNTSPSISPFESSSSPTFTEVNNTERRTDLTYLHTQLEIFYADNGYYPAVFDQSEFPGIDPEAAVDPFGTSIVSVDASTSTTKPVSPYTADFPVNSDYEYHPYACDGTSSTARCDKYVLFSWLDSEAPYSYQKDALN